MLEYCKTILKKVSFDSTLFEKELRKALSYVNKEERMKLLQWCKDSITGNDKQIVEQYILMLA